MVGWVLNLEGSSLNYILPEGVIIKKEEIGHKIKNIQKKKTLEQIVDKHSPGIINLRHISMRYSFCYKRFLLDSASGLL